MSKVLKVANCFLITKFQNFDYEISCESNKSLKHVLLLPWHMNLRNPLKQICIEFSTPWHMTLEGGKLCFQICTIQKGSGTCDNLVYLPSSLWFFSAVNAEACWQCCCFQEQAIMAQRRWVAALGTQRLEPAISNLKSTCGNGSIPLSPPSSWPLTPDWERHAGACLWLSVLQWKWPPVFLFHKRS